MRRREFFPFPAMRERKDKNMARMHDNQGKLVGGLAASTGAMPPAPAAYAPSRARLNPRFGAEETIPGLECSYGSFAYAYLPTEEGGVGRRSRLPGCHNPVEDPDERHHCAACGGDYCSVHAETSAHDCESVILPG